MTTMQAVKVPTPEEILRAQSAGGVEFVDGQLVEKPVSMISNFVARRIANLLGNEADKTGSAWVFESSMGYQCFADDPAKFRKPDVSVIRASRIAALDADPGLLPIPADLAVEVYSPTDKAADVEAKVEEYIDAGFAIIWGVQPRTRTVTIYRADGSVARLHENDEISGESALPTFKCKVAEFFVTPSR